MRRLLIGLLLGSISLLEWASGPVVTIPKTRLKIIYKETGQPVEWVMIQVFCLRTHLNRPERKELFERKKAAYEKRVSEGHDFPYEDFSSWKLEQFKTERSCGWRDFLHAEDGWITIPEVSDVRMDSYQIEITPAAGHIVNYPYEKEYVAFTEKSFPKFAALPEKDRVLEAFFTKQCNIPSGTLNPTYEEGRFFLAAYEIILNHWPELSAALGCGYGGDGPEFKGSYYGFLRYNCLLTMRSYIDPSYSLPGVPVIPAAQRQDLLDRSRQLFCNDIKAKQARWKDSRVPLLDLDFFRDLHCECMGVKGLGPCEQAPPAQAPPPAAPSPSAKPSGPSPAAPPPSAPASP